MAGGGGCQVSQGFQGKVSSLGPRPAVAGRAIYFSAPKPLSQLFTQGAKKIETFVANEKRLLSKFLIQECQK